MLQIIKNVSFLFLWPRYIDSVFLNSCKCYIQKNMVNTTLPKVTYQLYM